MGHKDIVKFTAAAHARVTATTITVSAAATFEPHISANIPDDPFPLSDAQFDAWLRTLVPPAKFLQNDDHPDGPFPDGPDDGLTVPARNAETLTDLVTDLGVLDVKVSMADAARMRQAARVYRFALAAAEDNATLLHLSAVDRTLRIGMAKRSVIAEIAAMLRLPARTAETLIHTALTLEDRLPSTLTAVEEGRALMGHARILVDESYSLPDELLAELERTMLPKAEGTTVRQFSDRVRTQRERLAPEAAVERQVRAEEDRGVELVPQRDGIVDLIAHLPAVQGVAIFNRLKDIAKAHKSTGDQRTTPQLMADVCSDLLLDVPGVDADGKLITIAGTGHSSVDRYRSIRPTVLVTIPASTITRDGTEPGILEGYGPIDPQTAREIAANAKRWRRLLTDPVTGAVLAMDRRHYRPTKDQQIWLRVRDGTCRWPGCRRSATGCDIDHTVAWSDGGHTDCDNLAHLCPKHHTEKHNTAWEQSQDAVGNVTSVSPAGFSYTTEPEVTVAPVTPEAHPPVPDTPPF